MPEKQNKKSEEKAANSSNLITDNKESISEKIKLNDSETKTNKDQNIVKDEVNEVINPSKQIRKKKEIMILSIKLRNYKTLGKKLVKLKAQKIRLFGLLTMLY